MKDPQMSISALRQMTCLLAGQSGDNILDRMRQGLQALCEMLPLAAAGMVWQQKDRSLLHVRWPEAGPLDPQLRAALANPTPSGQWLEGEGDGAWLMAAMRYDGVTMGRLWAVPNPGQILDDCDRDLLVLVANQLVLAYRNGQLYQDLTAQVEWRDVLLRRLMHVNEECRRRVARELHDEISQSLAALILQVDIAQAAWKSDPDLADRSLEKLRGELVRLVDEVHRMLLELRPVLLEQKGLLEALGWYGQERLQPLGTRFHVSGGKCAPGLPSLMRLTLYRIGQEAIANAARHGAAGNVWLDITCQDDELILTVRDDGNGFDTAEMVGQPEGLKGMGLLGMRERTLLLDGELEIESTPGQGTCVRARVPLDGRCPP